MKPVPTAPIFPLPAYDDGGRKRWAESDLINYDRALKGLEPAERDPADERWLTSAQVKRRYSVSQMWLHRRARVARAAQSAAQATSPK